MVPLIPLEKFPSKFTCNVKLVKLAQAPKSQTRRRVSDTDGQIGGQ